MPHLTTKISYYSTRTRWRITLHIFLCPIYKIIKSSKAEVKCPRCWRWLWKKKWTKPNKQKLLLIFSKHLQVLLHFFCYQDLPQLKSTLFGLLIALGFQTTLDIFIRFYKLMSMVFRKLSVRWIMSVYAVFSHEFYLTLILFFCGKTGIKRNF